jgi:hypothetical protein
MSDMPVPAIAALVRAPQIGAAHEITRSKPSFFAKQEEWTDWQSSERGGAPFRLPF